jgi:hypothetical protein
VTLPADIALLKYTWTRRRSDAWTDAAFRAIVLRFLGSFLTSHPWAKSWEVVEKFTDTAHALRASSVNVRVPTGPAGPPAVEDFKQRDGMRLLVFTFVRERDNERFEIGTQYPQGNATSSVQLARMLDRVQVSIEAAERST